VHRIRIESESHAVVLTAEGELDAYSAPELNDSLEDARVRELDRFVADLSKVSFMDSTALGLLVRTVKDVVDRGGRARIVLPKTSARRIFEITTLDRILPVAASRAEAVRDVMGNSRQGALPGSRDSSL
jgi:anti-sigma B factor antagonist